MEAAIKSATALSDALGVPANRLLLCERPCMSPGCVMRTKTLSVSAARCGVLMQSVCRVWRTVPVDNDTQGDAICAEREASQCIPPDVVGMQKEALQ